MLVWILTGFKHLLTIPVQLLPYSFICFCTSSHIFIFCDYLMYLCNILPMLLINFGLQYEGTLMYPGEGVTGTESGIWNSEDGSCVIERKQGRDTSGCTGEAVGFDCACAKLSCPVRGSRQLWHHLMMSLSLCLHWGELYKGACTSLWGSLGEFSSHLVIVEGNFLSFSSRGPPTPYLGYLSAL